MKKLPSLLALLLALAWTSDSHPSSVTSASHRAEWFVLSTSLKGPRSGTEVESQKDWEQRAHKRLKSIAPQIMEELNAIRSDKEIVAPIIRYNDNLPTVRLEEIDAAALRKDEAAQEVREKLSKPHTLVFLLDPVNRDNGAISMAISLSNEVPKPSRIAIIDRIRKKVR